MAGTTFTWTATTASAWTISGNWAPPGGPPAAGDTAIDPAGAILVNGGTVAAADLSIGGSLAAPLPGKGTITVTTGGEILVSDALAVWSGSTLSVDVNSSVDVGTSETFVAGNLVVENGHSLVGDGLIAASVDNLGTLEALGTVASNVFSPGTLEITGSVAGSGSIVLAGPDSIVQLDGSVSTGQTISFGTGSELILNAPGTGFAVPITNLNTGDKIEFAGLQVTSASVTSPGTITVVTKNGNYLLTDAKFAAGANQQFFTGTDPINGAGFIQVSPAFINWIGGAGNNLATGSNWQGGVAPNSTQVATLINNPGTLTGSVSALSVDIGNFNSVNTGTWTFNGTTITVAGQSTAPVGLPFAAGFNMNTVLNGGTLNAAGDTSIGSPGDATVTAQGGVQVTTLGDGVGPNAGQSGSLVLTDPGTTWTELSGAPVNGQDPGFLNFGFSGPANGLAGGAGFLTVTKSATLNTGGLAIFGGLAGGHGEGTISAGGIWNAQSVLVGSGGSGTLAVTGGALLSSTGALTFGANSGGFGAASVTGGTISAAGNVQIGSNGNGTMTIGAGGTVSAGGTFGGVGLNAGSDGYLQIVNGGVYKSTLASQTATVFNIGNNGTFGTTPAAVGSVLVSGQGSQLDLNGNPLSVGSNGGTGSLTVAQGGTVAAGTPDSNKASALQAGRAAGGTGAIIVTDPNSLLSLAGFVLLGQAGTGTLLVKNSGSVAINNAPTNGSGFFIGSGFSGGTPNVGGSGEATVTSSGQLTAQNINIGGNGSDGVLNVNSGGTVEAVTGVVIGDATSITGTVYGGTGTLNIGAGGVVKVTEPAQTNNFVIEVGTANSSVGGPTTLSDGVLNVSGVGALLDTNGNGIDVGRLGDGSLSVDQGASVVAGTQDFEPARGDDDRAPRQWQRNCQRPGINLHGERPCRRRAWRHRRTGHREPGQVRGWARYRGVGRYQHWRRPGQRDLYPNRRQRHRADHGRWRSVQPAEYLGWFLWGQRATDNHHRGDRGSCRSRSYRQHGHVRRRHYDRDNGRNDGRNGHHGAYRRRLGRSRGRQPAEIRRASRCRPVKHHRRQRCRFRRYANSTGRGRHGRFRRRPHRYRRRRAGFGRGRTGRHGGSRHSIRYRYRRISRRKCRRHRIADRHRSRLRLHQRRAV